jgi:hypothetical protein
VKISAGVYGSIAGSIETQNVIRRHHMTESMGLLGGTAVVVLLCAMFVIVFVVVRGALKETRLFGDVGSWPVAFGTAALSVVGLQRFFGTPGHGVFLASEARKADGVLDTILLPYVALAISLLFVLLLLALSECRPGKSATPRERRRARPAPKAETLTRKRQPAPQTSLRRRLEK